jgi:serine/threonine-protein kinase
MGDVESPKLDRETPRAEGGFFPGLVLDGRYRLESLLGQGGMGTVWVASQLTLQRQVAVKSLRVAAPSHRVRLQREAFALAAIHHPSIVEVYDYGETASGLPYVVMELVRGESLAERLDRVGALPAEEAVRLVLPILEGLAAAHRAGVVHRDIKPENVVLASGPLGVLPKLLDFGIARIDSDAGARVTVDGGLVGTPAYMAPEQMRDGPTDERVDVWGVGALLYHLLAGEAPFGASNVLLVMRRVLEEPPSYPRRARGLDGRLWGILTAALRKDRDERLPSADALRDALGGWLDARTSLMPGAIAAFSASAPPPRAASSLAPTLLAAPEARDEAPRSAVTSPSIDDAPPSIDALIRTKLGS